MKLHHIKIENYRSIEQCDIELSDLNILIGKNNAGKSNLSNAVNDYRRIVLQESGNKLLPDYAEWFENAVRNRDKEQAIHFKVHFRLTDDEFEEMVDAVGAAHSLRTSVLEKLNAVEGFREFVHELSASSDGIIHNSVQTEIEGTRTVLGELDTGSSPTWSHFDFEAFSEEVQTTTTSESTAEPINVFPVGVREIIDQSLTRWALVAPFRKPEDRRQVELGQALDPTGENLTDVLFEIQNDGTDRFSRIENKYVSIMEGVNGIRIPPQNEGGDIVVSVMVDEDGLKDAVPLEFISSGSKEILYLISRVILSETEIDYLFVEEPELHLHPAAEQEIFELIQDVAESSEGPQLMVTTHSDVFLDESNLDSILSIRRNRSSTVSPIQGADELDDHLAALGYEKSELLQSDRVLFVEGRSDQVIFEQFADIRGSSFGKNGVSVRVINGDPDESEIGPMTDLLGQMGIPYRFVFDSDGGNPEEKKLHMADQIGESPNNVWILEEYCIESYLIENPRAVSQVLPIEESDAQRRIQDMSRIANKKNVLNELFKDTLEMGYNEEMHGGLIAAQFSKGEISNELSDMIENIVELERR